MAAARTEQTNRTQALIRGIKLLLLTGCILAANLMTTRPQAAEDAEGQQQVELLYKLTRFVQWPPSAWHIRQQHIHICVVGNSLFNDQLDSLHGKQSQGLEIRVEGIKSTSELKECALVFFNTDNTKLTADILNSLDGAPVLTVSAIPDFTKEKGMVEFLGQDHHKRIRVNLQRVRNSGLLISSRLLRMADFVRH